MEDVLDVQETEEAINNTPDPVEPTTEEALRQEIFKLNGITDEMIAAFKVKYGEIGWTTFSLSTCPFPVVFIYRPIRRDEWRNEVKPFMVQDGVTEDDADEYVSSFCTVFPKEAGNISFWIDKGALIPKTLSNIIMEISGAQPVTAPMKL